MAMLMDPVQCSAGILQVIRFETVFINHDVGIIFNLGDLTDNSVSDRIGSLTVETHFKEYAGQIKKPGLVGLCLAFFDASLFMDFNGGISVYDIATDKTEAIIQR